MSYIKGDKVGNFEIIAEMSKDVKYRKTYLCKCLLCNTFVKVRHDKLKTLRHCLSSHTSCKYPLKSLRYSHSYIIKYGVCCARWTCFRNFRDDILEELGPKPSPSYALTRIDSSLTFCPGNIKWAYYYDIHGNGNWWDTHEAI